MKTAALHNLGCKVNAYETEAMQQLLEASGYRIVDFSQKADIYIINTCSVTMWRIKNPGRCFTEQKSRIRTVLWWRQAAMPSLQKKH